jgi:hypothetical protein
METLSPGRPISILQNVVYALPTRRASLYTSDAAPTLVQSNDPLMVATTAVTLVEGQYTNVGGEFIKCTSGNITIQLKTD